ncbi:hypothetical protein AURDEDRAFT_148771 [Auricularia subglabra TFB-10046 SS5]|nr:hypothetical protein AURDEDRAFT_148771 [Auricularia subglabra TFB-10046 SS5]
MRVHAQDPSPTCIRPSEEGLGLPEVLPFASQPADLDVVEANIPATPDNSVMLHPSSPPASFSYPALSSSAFSAPMTADDYPVSAEAAEDEPSTQLPDTDSLGDVDAGSTHDHQAAFDRLDWLFEDALGDTSGDGNLRAFSRDTSVTAKTQSNSSPYSPAVPNSPPPFVTAREISLLDAAALPESHDTPDPEITNEPESEEPTIPEQPSPITITKRKGPSPEPKSESAPPPSPKRQKTETPVRAQVKDKRMSASARDMAASRAKSMKKLATPFRSPLVAQPTNVSAPATPTPAKLGSGPSFKRPAAVTVTRLVRETSDAAVTSPFCPPVPKASAPQPTVLTVQNLERRLQTLKRAIKIKSDGGDATLEALAVKWRDAARAASWDLYELVRDGAGTSDRPAQGAGGWNDGNWGWGSEDTKQFGSDGQQSSVDYEDQDMETDPEEEAPEKPDPSVGTMLAELGIAPALLGWKEDEGDFLDG